jgi:hypothetical protein
MGFGLDTPGSRQGPLEGFCEHGNEPSGFIQCCDFLGSLSNCWFIKKDSNSMECWGYSMSPSFSPSGPLTRMTGSTDKIDLKGDSSSRGLF